MHERGPVRHRPRRYPRLLPLLLVDALIPFVVSLVR